MNEFQTLNELVRAAEVEEKKGRRREGEMEKQKDGETKYKANGKHHSSSSSSPAKVPPGGRDLRSSSSEPPEDCRQQADEIQNPISKTPNRTWAPDANDHFIYRLVKFQGNSQATAAEFAGVSQATVSRVIQRYERWKAHAQERDGGQLDPAERMRTQWWLTYERNEVILASCLRLANDLEGLADVSRTVMSRPASSPCAEFRVSTETSMLDRSGRVERFLRLAHRINMEQFKLSADKPPPLPEPLSADEVAQQEAQAAADREAILAVEANRWRLERDVRADGRSRPPGRTSGGVHEHENEHDGVHRQGEAPAEPKRHGDEETRGQGDGRPVNRHDHTASGATEDCKLQIAHCELQNEPAASLGPTSDLRPPTSQPAAVNDVNKMNNGGGGKTAVSSEPAEPCAPQPQKWVLMPDGCIRIDGPRTPILWPPRDPKFDP